MCDRQLLQSEALVSPEAAPKWFRSITSLQRVKFYMLILFYVVLFAEVYLEFDWAACFLSLSLAAAVHQMTPHTELRLNH